MLKTFRGGVHPDDRKSLVKDCPIQVFPPPRRATVLMSQHLGAPCKPCVEKGQRVLTGQEIGAAQGFVSAPVHAPVTGKVVEIGQAYHPVTGRNCPAVIIERDGEGGALEAAIAGRPGEGDRGLGFAERGGAGAGHGGHERGREGDEEKQHRETWHRHANRAPRSG